MDYFFGCWSDKGHFLYNINGKRFHSSPDRFPLRTHYILDGYMIEKNKEYSIWWLNDEWTFLAMWDNSVDKREGSNCCFVLNGDYDLDSAIKHIKDVFPEHISNRLDNVNSFM